MYTFSSTVRNLIELMSRMPPLTHSMRVERKFRREFMFKRRALYNSSGNVLTVFLEPVEVPVKKYETGYVSLTCNAKRVFIPSIRLFTDSEQIDLPILPIVPQYALNLLSNEDIISLFSPVDILDDVKALYTVYVEHFAKKNAYEVYEPEKVMMYMNELEKQSPSFKLEIVSNTDRGSIKRIVLEEKRWLADNEEIAIDTLYIHTRRGYLPLVLRQVEIREQNKLASENIEAVEDFLKIHAPLLFYELEKKLGYVEALLGVAFYVSHLLKTHLTYMPI